MAIQVQKPAPGNAPNTGSPGPTPAPHAEFDRTAGQQYGENQFPGFQPKGGASSLNPGQKHTNDYLAPSDEVRDTIIARGLNTKDDASTANFQIRKLSDKTVPTHSAMASRAANSGSPGGTVPSKLGITQEAPLPQRNAYGDNKNG